MFAAQLSLRRSLAGSASLAGARRGLASAVKPPPGGGTFTQSVSPAPVPSTLHLKSGHSFVGQSFGAPRTQFGEVVFTTSITSYTESLTDPSYQGQILTFTQPLMGNYGVPDNFCGRSPVGHPADVDVGAFLESRGIQAAGVIVSNLCDRFSHFEAKESLAAWCARHNVPGISGIDTRALTTLLRNQGSTLGGIVVGKGHEATPDSSNYFDPMAMNLIQRVSTTEPYTVHPKGGESQARAHIALLDFGAKANITRSLLRQGVSVTVLPWNYDFNAVRDNFDGLFLSNGPGSPHSIPEAIETTRVAINEWDRPIFGICMGNQVSRSGLKRPEQLLSVLPLQIIGLAAGIKAYRMKVSAAAADRSRAGADCAAAVRQPRPQPARDLALDDPRRREHARRPCLRHEPEPRLRAGAADRPWHVRGGHGLHRGVRLAGRLGAALRERQRRLD